MKVRSNEQVNYLVNGVCIEREVLERELSYTGMSLPERNKTRVRREAKTGGEIEHGEYCTTTGRR